MPGGPGSVTIKNTIIRISSRCHDLPRRLIHARFVPMSQVLFVAALFLIVLLALNFEYLIFPSLPVTGLGILLALFGAGIILYGVINKRKTGSKQSESSGPEKVSRSAGCAPAVAGGLFLLTGIGVLVMQAIGYLQ
jgi:hypothetical protein